MCDAHTLKFFPSLTICLTPSDSFAQPHSYPQMSSCLRSHPSVQLSYLRTVGRPENVSLQPIFLLRSLEITPGGWLLPL